ncbi:uncharacterized protein LOC126264134 isoform X2 [Aethina tumida]|uniref:uncharacterized protein LOC126264134 isoform X2 n=1 Tax=Aethina tumida TaxID=116153 RepID=UPI0021479623|nr:uncharacterized protein LOC126264134 isoform X2 [Aethina tumida]
MEDDSSPEDKQPEGENASETTSSFNFISSLLNFLLKPYTNSNHAHESSSTQESVNDGVSTGSINETEVRSQRYTDTHSVTSSLPSYHTFNEPLSAASLFRVRSAYTQPEEGSTSTKELEQPEETRADITITQSNDHDVLIDQTFQQESYCPSSSSRPHHNEIVQERHFSSTPIIPAHSNHYFVYNIADVKSLQQFTPRMTKSLTRNLPTYSTVLKLGPAASPKPHPMRASESFKPRQPPPSYAEAEGLYDAHSAISVVLTETRLERSTATHFTAILLCLCYCWPCCLLPYCMKSCYNVVHTCPLCQYYFGTYRPW